MIAAVVGVYAAAPDRAMRDRLVARLAEVEAVAGVEVPWPDREGSGDHWSAAHAGLPPHWKIVVTGIPHVVARSSVDPAYGLASDDDDGRTSAVADVARLRDDVARLADERGAAPLAVELHAAPRQHRRTADRLTASLDAIAGWDWGATLLTLEHCDALIPDQTPQKGWSTLEAEVSAVLALDGAIGITLNWGRSAIEFRDPDRVVEHVAYAQAAGALRAIVFSGACDQDTDYGPAWTDSHPPFAIDPLMPSGEPASLMTTTRVREALARAGSLEWAGLKVGLRPRDSTLERRIAVIDEGARAIVDTASSLRYATGERS